MFCGLAFCPYKVGESPQRYDVKQIYVHTKQRERVPSLEGDLLRFICLFVVNMTHFFNQ